MDLNDIKALVFSTWFKWLIGLLGGAMLTWLKTKRSRIAGPLLYGMVGFAAIEVILFLGTPISGTTVTPTPDLVKSIEGLSTYVHAMNRPASAKASSIPLAVTPETLERNIRTWLGVFGYGFTPLPMNNAHFGLQVNLPSGRHVMVFRETDQRFEGYVALQGTAIVSAEHQAILTRMPADQRQRVLHNLNIEMARFRTEYSNLTLQQILFGRRLIIASLTQDTFMQNIGEMEAEENLMVETVLRDIGQ